MEEFQSVSVKILSESKNAEIKIGILSLNRPSKSNAMNEKMWSEIPKALSWMDEMGCRTVVLSGEGKHFCAGIDLDALGGELLSDEGNCPARSRMRFIQFLSQLQDSMTSCETFKWPVIAAIHGVCYGAGIDLITCCDLRYSTSDSKFSVLEVDRAITADMGTLARLPGIVGDGNARDLALTARTIDGNEAHRMHLVSQTFASREDLMQNAIDTAFKLAAKSPLALVGTKKVLLHQRDHSIRDGLEYVANWNAAMLPGSHDLKEVFAAVSERRPPKFSKL